MPDEEQQQEQQSAADLQQQEQQQQGLRQLAQEQRRTDHSCGLLEGVAVSAVADQQPLLLQQQSGSTGSEQCPTNNTCSAGCGLTNVSANTTSSAVALGGVKQGGAKGGSSSGGGKSGGSSSSTSLVRVARGAAYPLITLLRHVSSAVVAGLGSTTAVALGTGLGVLRLGKPVL
jgi:type II secretory pathway pseudopilin PulG